MVRGDIFRLFTILDPQSIFPISKEIKADMQIAFDKLASEKIDLRAFGIRDITVTDILNELSQYYEVKKR